MKYVIKKRCTQKIISFYRNVSKKYKHTYSEELMVRPSPLWMPAMRRTCTKTNRYFHYLF